MVALFFHCKNFFKAVFALKGRGLRAVLRCVKLFYIFFISLQTIEVKIEPKEKYI